MSHLEGTDLWFKTLKVRRGTRIHYQLSPNRPAGEWPEANGQRRSRADPHKPKHEPDDPKLPLERVWSLLELPGALPRPWYTKRPDVPHYSTTQEKITCEHLKSLLLLVFAHCTHANAENVWNKDVGTVFALELSGSTLLVGATTGLYFGSPATIHRRTAQPLRLRVKPALSGVNRDFSLSMQTAPP